MAHLLQRLIPGLALAAPLAAQSFSHRLHLKLKPDCVGCHSTAAASASASENNLPGPASCRPCHDKPIPVKRPASLLVTRFSHALHGKLGNAAPVIAAAIRSGTYHRSTTGEPPPKTLLARLNTTNACQACHRGLEQSDSVSKDSFPQMQDCLVCHVQIDPPFSCEKCHEPGNHLKPADHHATYIDTHSTGKANLNKQSCVVCHARRFTCLGCH